MKGITKYIFIFLIFFLFIIIVCYNNQVFAVQTSGLNNNWVYLVTNKNSRKCLNVNYGTDSNGTNVTQYVQDGSLEQKFKLVYNSSSDAYKLYCMCSSGGNNRVIDVLRTGGLSSGSIQSGNNVDIWIPNDNAAQEFIITYRGAEGDADDSSKTYPYYSIGLKSNTNLALTSYGTGNGSGSGTTQTSVGNVYISTYTGSNEQKWFFETPTIYGIVELLSWDLVDSGKHLDWGGTTKYQSQFEGAVNTWNNYKGGVIRKDGTATIKDVTISDVNLGDTNVLGQTNPLGSIRFNTYKMDTISTTMQLNVCLHELGHALGLNHRSARGAIMQNYATTLTALSNAEKVSYDYAYNNKY